MRKGKIVLGVLGKLAGVLTYAMKSSVLNSMRGSRKKCSRICF
jgi:hypothetical protein